MSLYELGERDPFANLSDVAGALGMKNGEKLKFVFREKPAYNFVKRVFDVACSLAAIMVLSPVMLAIAAAVVIDDFGSPIFMQRRTGKNGKEFWMLKFRSMHVGAEKRRGELLALNKADGPLFKLKEDPRVTRVGKILRKFSLDELPQLFNILIGNMAIVGPRPFVTYEQDKFDGHAQQRLLVKPGLSCYWQVGGHHDATHEELVESDLRYIMERSVWVDLKIIFRTVWVVARSKGV